MTDVAPVRREIVVVTTVARAFELFTARIGDWWPINGFSVFGDGTVSFEGDELVERSGERVAVWAEVTRWDPPHSIALSWHAGSALEHSTDVTVSFSPEADRTRVTVTHSGWHRSPQPEAAAKEYGNGWPAVLGAFAQSIETAAARWR